MIKNIRIKQIYTNSLSCELMLERTQNGEFYVSVRVTVPSTCKKA